MAEIGKVNIDFTVIPDFDPNTLVVGDLSNWFSAETLPATMSIYPPGSAIPVNNVFQKHKLNIFTSINLGLDCLVECEEQPNIDLQDGVWKLILISGLTGFDKTRYFLKTDRFRMDMDKIYIRIGLEYDKKDKQFRDDLQDIELLLQTAEAHTRVGDFYKADRDFTEAVRLQKKYSECKDCI